MKKLLLPLFAGVAALAGTGPLAAQTAPAAQPPIRVYVVDVVKLFEAHPRTVEMNAQFTTEQQQATATLSGIQTELKGYSDRFKALDDESQNPLLKEDVRTRNQQEMQKIATEAQQKQLAAQNFKAEKEADLSKRIANFRGLMLEEIGKVAYDIALKKGATFLVDKSAVSVIGMKAFLYTDPAYDITDEVKAEIDRTATVPAAPGAAPAAATLPGGTAAPAAPKGPLLPPAPAAAPAPGPSAK